MLTKRQILGELDFTGHVYRSTIMSSLAWSGGPWGEGRFSKLRLPDERHNVSLFQDSLAGRSRVSTPVVVSLGHARLQERRGKR